MPDDVAIDKACINPVGQAWGKPERPASPWDGIVVETVARYQERRRNLNSTTVKSLNANKLNTKLP
ncbi:MAG: hypothetical protein JWO30_181 [Fibrobacteres bacterium]|nr:hypothetical protein [Fibrobacterota bacterium]